MTWQATETRPTKLPHLDSLPRVSRVLVTIGYGLARWQSRARSRRALSRLDLHLLNDIGMSADLREVEVEKPFWRA